MLTPLGFGITRSWPTSIESVAYRGCLGGADGGSGFKRGADGSHNPREAQGGAEGGFHNRTWSNPPFENPGYATELNAFTTLVKNASRHNELQCR